MMKIKKIIGKLLLSDGKPCYSLNERLWRKFSSKEAMEKSYDKCELEIFNNLNDDRYINIKEMLHIKKYMKIIYQKLIKIFC